VEDAKEFHVVAQHSDGKNHDVAHLVVLVGVPVVAAQRRPPLADEVDDLALEGVRRDRTGHDLVGDGFGVGEPVDEHVVEEVGVVVGGKEPHAGDPVFADEVEDLVALGPVALPRRADKPRGTGFASTPASPRASRYE
jgi:hypothetical protein